MIINPGSKIEDIRQAIQGTWSNIKDNDWSIIELGTIKIYQKLCNSGKNVLPNTFLKNRTSICGYFAFTKNAVNGGVIGVQDQYIELESNSLVLVIQF